MTPIIRPITLADVAGYNGALDLVARELRYLRSVEAPAIQSSVDFVAHNLATGNPHFVALHDGAVIGWCDICRSGDRGLEHVGSLGMGLIGPWRGRGIGKQLLQATLADAQTRFRRVELDVYDSNAAAIRLYEQNGFSHEGIRREAILLGQTYHDIIMMAQLYPEASPHSIF